MSTSTTCRVTAKDGGYLTKKEARALQMVALTTVVEEVHAPVIRGICDTLEKGGVRYAIVTAGLHTVQIWRAQEGFINPGVVKQGANVYTISVRGDVRAKLSEWLRGAGFASTNCVRLGKFLEGILNGEWRRKTGVAMPELPSHGDGGGARSMVVPDAALALCQAAETTGKYPSRLHFLYDIACGNWERRKVSRQGSEAA